MGEYAKAMAARKARERALKKAKAEQAQMRYRERGSFIHLTPVSMSLRRG